MAYTYHVHITPDASGRVSDVTVRRHRVGGPWFPSYMAGFGFSAPEGISERELLHLVFLALADETMRDDWGQC